MNYPATLISVCFVLIPAICCGQVSPSIESQITSDLRANEHCDHGQTPINVEQVRIGKGKVGFLGTCNPGGGVSIVYEQTPEGLRRLLTVERQMNDDFFPGETIINGYFEMILVARSGSEAFSQHYWWNGERYVESTWK